MLGRPRQLEAWDASSYGGWRHRRYYAGDYRSRQTRLGIRDRRKTHCGLSWWTCFLVWEQLVLGLLWSRWQVDHWHSM